MRALLRGLIPPALLEARRSARERRWRRRPIDELLPTSSAFSFRKWLAVEEALTEGKPLLRFLDEPMWREEDERLIEYSWCFENLATSGTGQRILDAGCVLNRPCCTRALAELFAERWFLNIEYEPLADTGRASMIVADARRVPLPDGHFDAVVCLSTLEHIGMDNSAYTSSGFAAAPSCDPASEQVSALAELRRLTRIGGILLFTVPYGVKADHSSFRVLGEDDLGQLVRSLGAETSVDLFRVTPGGWMRATADECRDAHYGDGVAAASAVACVRHVRR